MLVCNPYGRNPGSRFFTIKIDVGLSANLAVNMTVHVRQPVMDIILELQRFLSPQFDRNDITLVYRTTQLQMWKTAEESGLVEGDEVQAVIFEAWTLKVQIKQIASSKCECIDDCHNFVWGHNFTVNTGALKPVFKKGVPCRFGELTSCLVHPYLINDGEIATDDLADLALKSDMEQLWTCNICSQVTFTCGQFYKRPREWLRSSSGKCYCLACYLCFLYDYIPYNQHGQAWQKLHFHKLCDSRDNSPIVLGDRQY